MKVLNPFDRRFAAPFSEFSQIIFLADFKPIMPQNSVSGGDMKIKIRQRAIQQERQPIERERAIADFELDLRVLGTDDLLGLEATDAGNRLANALDQFGKRGFI